MPAPQEVRKSIVILKSKADALTGVEQFLKNREWQILSTSNLKEALVWLVSKSPSFIMISVDHPNRKTRVLPKVLSESFPVFAIAFAESSSAVSFKTLTDSPAKYRINPPATGPAVERMINRILKDLEQEKSKSQQERERVDPNALGASGEGVTVIQGSASASGGGVGLQSLSSLLVQLAEDKNDLEDTQNFIQKGIGAIDSAAQGSDLAGAAPLLAGEGGKSSGLPGEWVPLEAASPQAKSKQSASEKPMPRYDEEDILDSGRKKGSSETILVKGTERALHETAAVKDGLVRERLEDSSHAACLVVESSRFAGYLIAALGRNRPLDAGLLDTIRDRLFSFLKENGEDISDDAAINIRLKKVDFEDWALDCADFLKKSVHHGEEIALAYFPTPTAKLRLQDSPASEMGAVEIHEIEPEVELDLNLYIYLAANQKYVLYTPKGSKLGANQKERLLNKGVAHVHVKKTELKGLEKHRAQSYLNAQINGHQQKKKKPPRKAS